MNPPGWRPRAGYAFSPRARAPNRLRSQHSRKSRNCAYSPNSRRVRAGGADDPARTAPFHGGRNRHRRGASPTGYFRRIDPDSSDSAFRARQGVPAGAQAEHTLHHRRQGRQDAPGTDAVPSRECPQTPIPLRNHRNPPRNPRLNHRCYEGRARVRQVFRMCQLRPPHVPHTPGSHRSSADREYR